MISLPARPGRAASTGPGKYTTASTRAAAASGQAWVLLPAATAMAVLVALLGLTLTEQGTPGERRHARFRCRTNDPAGGDHLQIHGPYGDPACPHTAWGAGVTVAATGVPRTEAMGLGVCHRDR